jgi:hypothetical protein
MSLLDLEEWPAVRWSKKIVDEIVKRIAVPERVPHRRRA